MNTPYHSAQLAAKTVANYFLLEHWTAPTTINIGEIRELRDSLTVIDFYLKKKREEIEARLLDSAYEFEYQREIRDGYLGDHVPSHGAGPDYELPPGKGDGQLVEVVVREPSGGETGGMQLG